MSTAVQQSLNFPEKDTPLYKNDHFYVYWCDFRDPVIEETVTGYGIFNRINDVREAEARRLDVAVQLADAYADAHVRMYQEEAEKAQAKGALMH